MTNIKTERKSAIGVRPRPEIRSILEDIAQDEKRTVANVIVYIVDQYLSSTNGRLLKHVKVVPENEHAA